MLPCFRCPSSPNSNSKMKFQQLNTESIAKVSNIPANIMCPPLLNGESPCGGHVKQNCNGSLPRPPTNSNIIASTSNGSGGLNDSYSSTNGTTVTSKDGKELQQKKVW